MIYLFLFGPVMLGMLLLVVTVIVRGILDTFFIKPPFLMTIAVLFVAWLYWVRIFVKDKRK